VKHSQMKPVTSSNIDRLGHDGKDLFVAFKSGALYRYEGVPKPVYTRGLEAESVGRWFIGEVKGSYPHVVDDAE
jgi:hypothetical protein